jgi:hypothetical protein
MSKNKKDLERQLARFKMGWPETDEALEQGIRIMEEIFLGRILRYFICYRQ